MKTAETHQPPPTTCGAKSLFTAETTSSSPVTTKRTAMTKVAMFSIRPCPWGCSESGSLPLILNPTKTTIDEAISEKVWTASAIAAILPMAMPIISFTVKRKRLPAILTTASSNPRSVRYPVFSSFAFLSRGIRAPARVSKKPRTANPSLQEK